MDTRALSGIKKRNWKAVCVLDWPRPDIEEEIVISLQKLGKSWEEGKRSPRTRKEEGKSGSHRERSITLSSLELNPHRRISKTHVKNTKKKKDKAKEQTTKLKTILTFNVRSTTHVAGIENKPIRTENRHKSPFCIKLTEEETTNVDLWGLLMQVYSMHV